MLTAGGKRHCFAVQIPGEAAQPGEALKNEVHRDNCWAREKAKLAAPNLSHSYFLRKLPALHLSSQSWAVTQISCLELGRD